MFSHCRKCQVFLCVTYCIWYIDNTRQFSLVLLFVVIFNFFYPSLWKHCQIHVFNDACVYTEPCNWEMIGKGDQASQKYINEYFCWWNNYNWAFGKTFKALTVSFDWWSRLKFNLFLVLAHIQSVKCSSFTNISLIMVVYWEIAA